MSLTLQGRSIWEARTNIVTYSRAIGALTGWTVGVTSDAVAPTLTPLYAAGPSGEMVACRFESDVTAATTGAISRVLIATAAHAAGATAKHSSFYLKSNTASSYAVQIVGWAGGGAKLVTVTPTWQRFDTTFTFDSTSVSNVRVQLTKGTTADACDILISDVQNEVGASASPVIITTGAAATRAADVPRILDLSTIGYNAAEGTMVAEFVVPPAALHGGFPMVCAFSDGTNNNRIYLFVHSGGATGAQTFAGGVNQGLTTLGTVAPGNTAKVAFAYKADDFAGSINGAAVATDTSFTVPVVDRLAIGRMLTTSYLNSTIKSLTYIPRRVTNAELQALSTL